jgi:hypothetical protein
MADRRLDLFLSEWLYGSERYRDDQGAALLKPHGSPAG